MRSERKVALWSALVISMSAVAAAGLAPRQGEPEPARPPAAPAEAAKTRPVVVYSTRGDNKLHVLDAADLALIGSHDLGLGAHELTVSPDGRWLLGTAYGGPGPGHQPADRRIAVFDLRASKIHRTLDAAPLSRPNDAAFMPDSTHAYVTFEAPPRILKVNVESGQTTPITLEHGTNHMLALSRDAKRLAVVHVMPGGLTLIDTSTDTVLSHIVLPNGAEGPAFTRDHSKVWVACNRSDKIVIVDVALGKVEREIDCAGFPFRLRISPDGKTAAVSVVKSDEIALLDTTDPAKVRRVLLRETAKGATTPIEPLVPTSIAFTPDGTRVAVVCSGGKGEIVLVDVAQAKVIARRKTDGPIPDALTASLVPMPPK